MHDQKLKSKGKKSKRIYETFRHVQVSLNSDFAPHIFMCKDVILSY